MTPVHEFTRSQQVEARHTATLDAWLHDGYELRDATMAEQWQGIDRIAITDEGPVTLDYKCDERAATTKRLFIETVSNSVTGRPGWARSSEADWLVYFVVPDTVWMFLMRRIRHALPAWLRTYGERRARNVRYDTLGVCVPIADAEKAVEYIAYLHRGDGAILQPSDRNELRLS